MELFEYWWLESQQDDNLATVKEVAKEAWEAAKSLYKPISQQPTQPETKK